jgi:hypothetical protein
VTATTTARPTRVLALPTWILKHKALVAFCALVGAYYLWTVWSSGSPIAFHQSRTDYHNLLSDGFLSGHLHLNVTPDPRLLALPDPYDPVANAGLKAQDLSLYHDKYYLYWGPTPALLLYIPFRLLGLGAMPPTLAVFLFAFVGFCFSIACLRALTQRFTPNAPRWMLAATAIALALANALPFTMRRVAVYEVTITAAFCLTFIALYLIITGLRDGVRLGRLGAASLLIGLAVGARATMIVWAFGLIVLAAVLYRRSPDRQARLQILGVLLAPVALIGFLLMLYNALRFGNPTEFGVKYQLTSHDPATHKGYQLAYVPPGIWYYLFSPPYLTLGFPYINLPSEAVSYPFTAPARYDGVQIISGLLPIAPFTVFALAAPAVLRGTARRVTLGLIALAFLIIVMASYALWGATIRYEVDFASLLLITAALGWIGWAGRLSGLRRRLLTVGGMLLITWSVACGAAFGFMGYFQSLRFSSPDTFTRLQELTSFIPTLASAIDGEPKAIDVYTPIGVENTIGDPFRGVGTVTFHQGSVTFALGPPAVLTVASGSPRRYGLQLSAAPPQPPPRGTVVTIRMRDTGKVMQIPASLGPTILPISLRRGLNRIEFSVANSNTVVTRMVEVRIVPLPAAAP